MGIKLTEFEYFIIDNFLSLLVGVRMHARINQQMIKILYKAGQYWSYCYLYEFLSVIYTFIDYESYISNS